MTFGSLSASSLSQLFEATLIFNSGFKRRLVLAPSNKFFPHNLFFAVRKWLRGSLASFFYFPPLTDV